MGFLNRCDPFQLAEGNARPSPVVEGHQPSQRSGLRLRGKPRIIQLKAPFGGSTAAPLFYPAVFASACSWRTFGKLLSISRRFQKDPPESCLSVVCCYVFFFGFAWRSNLGGFGVALGAICVHFGVWRRPKGTKNQSSFMTAFWNCKKYESLTF